MAVGLFAGVPVSDFAAVLGWYERVFGKVPAFRPHEAETYGDGVRKITYRDADGNEISFGGAPA